MSTLLTRIPRDHYIAIGPVLSIGSHLLPILAVVPIIRGFRPTEGQLGGILSAMSIFAALLFGILIPAGDQARRLKDQLKLEKEQIDEVPPDQVPTRVKSKIKKLETHHKAAKDILSSVAYSIVVSLVDVLILIITFCMRAADAPGSAQPSEPGLYPVLLGASAYFFIFLLVILFFVVRAVYGSWFEEAK